MKQSSLSDFLREHGVSDATSKVEVARLKRVYWQSYHKAYYQERKKRHHRLTLRLSEEEYARLQSYAQEHEGISFSTFIKQSALAYQEQGYIPRNPNAVHELVASIRKIGRVVNQVVQSLHRIRRHRSDEGNRQGETVTVDEILVKKWEREYAFLVKRVGELEREVKAYMSSPPQKVGEVLVEVLEKDPSKIGEVRKMLDELEQKLLK